MDEYNFFFNETQMTSANIKVKSMFYAHSRTPLWDHCGAAACTSAPHPPTPLPEVRSCVLAVSLFGLSSGWVSGVDLHHMPPGTLHCLAQFEGKAAQAASGRRFFWSQTEVMGKLSKCE